MGSYYAPQKANKYKLAGSFWNRTFPQSASFPSLPCSAPEPLPSPGDASGHASASMQNTQRQHRWERRKGREQSQQSNTVRRGGVMDMTKNGRKGVTNKQISLVSVQERTGEKIGSLRVQRILQHLRAEVVCARNEGGCVTTMRRGGDTSSTDVTWCCRVGWRASAAPQPGYSVDAFSPAACAPCAGVHRGGVRQVAALQGRVDDPSGEGVGTLPERLARQRSAVPGVPTGLS